MPSLTWISKYVLIILNLCLFYLSMRKDDINSLTSCRLNWYRLQ